jgi:hypothetical protein
MTVPTTSKPPLPGRFLRKSEVYAILSISPTQLNDEVKAKRIEPGTRLTANSNILVWLSDYIAEVVAARWNARGTPQDQARADMCKWRATNAASHRRIAKKRGPNK